MRVHIKQRIPCPYPDLLCSPKLPKSIFASHGPISIPTLTVMAVATEFHRSFLIPKW